MGIDLRKYLTVALILLLSPMAPASSSGEASPVVIFTIDFCPACLGAKQWFRDNDITFHELNIEQSEAAAERFRQIGGRGIPLILVDGQRLQGFSPEAFRRIRPAPEGDDHE